MSKMLTDAVKSHHFLKAQLEEKDGNITVRELVIDVGVRRK